MAVLALVIKNCNSRKSTNTDRQIEQKSKRASQRSAGNSQSKADGLDRNPSKIFFTKHARCRMECRHISQKEVKEILAEGAINYNKSDLNDAQGPTYAVEGITSDRQNVRIIFAPKASHLSVVTVIDLQEDYACNCK